MLLFYVFFAIAPQHDSRSDATWQANSADLQSTAVQRNVDKTSYTTQHYAFLSGQDAGGAIGIAYLSTPCLKVSSGKPDIILSQI